MLNKKNLFAFLQNDLDERKLKVGVVVLTNRQSFLLGCYDYEYIRSYIKWLFEKNRSLVEIAYFIRINEDIETFSIKKILKVAKIRFEERKKLDFLCDITFNEYLWLCSNVNLFI